MELMNANQVMAVMIAVTILVLMILAVKIRRGVRRFFNSAEVRLFRELVRSVQNGELQQEEPPKSLGGMNSIYLPQILRDFPEFNWEELRGKMERSVQELLEEKNVRSAGVVRIHKTVISRYQKYNGTASIFCETGAEYWVETENQRNGQTAACNVRPGAKERSGQNGAAQQVHKKQTVCEAELVYVYDSSLSGTAASLVCQNCGAPVEQLGVKQCRYCGSVLEVSGARLWKVQNVRERNVTAQG